MPDQQALAPPGEKRDSTGRRYYADFSGVARPHNFYPSPPLTSEDGVAVALGMGRSDVGEGFVRWDWLGAQPALTERGAVRHLRFARPVKVWMNGKANQGVIYKPDSSA